MIVDASFTQSHKVSDKLVNRPNVQQLREAFPFRSAPRFVIFDRDAKYGLEVPAAVRSLRVNPVRTSLRLHSAKDFRVRLAGLHHRYDLAA